MATADVPAPRRRPPIARSLPVAYLAAAIAIAAILLPTALRPPQDQQNTSAAFSPDAPPDDSPPEALLQSLRQARSSTAGGAPPETVLLSEEEDADRALPPPPVRRPSRNKCFGDPPRQTESLYSALCVPAWTGGDNGGATAPGVSDKEIRVAVAVGLDSEVPEGPLEREFRDTDVRDTHLLKVWQTYFNSRFEFYGRYLQFIVFKSSTTNATQQRTATQGVKNTYNPFAILNSGRAAAVDESVRLKMLDFGASNNPVPFYNDHFPYSMAFQMDSWQTRYMATEIACKHYVGKPPGELNERMDRLMDYGKPRVWGIISYQDETRSGATDMYKDLLRRCGAEVKLAQEYNLTSNQQGISGAMAKFRAEGVTTLILAVDGLTPTVLTEEANRIDYYPEYIAAGTGGIDSNATGRLMNDTQARHVVGLSPNEIARPDPDKDWYRAYKEVDPEGDPDSDWFRDLQQLSGGIQMAGPKLTHQSFWAGLTKQPYRAPIPEWSIGGGYRDSFGFIAYKDLTYMDYMTTIWFDQTGDDPDSDFTGAWCHMWNGRRFKVGEIPTEPFPWRDPKQCIITPPRGELG